MIVLCSDKFMATQYGKGIREYVDNTSKLLRVYDLSSIFPFEAAVLSAVYIFEKILMVTVSIIAQIGLK